MDDQSKNFTTLDNYILSKFTYDTHKQTKNRYRKVYCCNINGSFKCRHIVYDHTFSELNRFIIHLKTDHPLDFSNKMTIYIDQTAPNDFSKISCCEILCDYIIKVILPNYSSKHTSIVSKIKSSYISNNENHILDLTKIDTRRINQVILENGISENQPISTITSKKHVQFVTNFIKLGYELGRNTDISNEDFLKFVNEIHLSRDILTKVGEDYFYHSIKKFQNTYASFLVDAGQINKREILVFVITSCNNLKYPFLFDLIQDFDGTCENYRNEVKKMIEKARYFNIEIVGITSDNLPVQIQGISHQSEESFQNKFKDFENVLHFRCFNHLLALAYDDWMDDVDELTIFEKSIKNIMSILKHKHFSKKLTKKIPSFGRTRWYSPFKAIHVLFEQRSILAKLFENPNKKTFKDLKKIKNDVIYLFNTGFTKVYPLLIPFYKLTNILQNNEISCIDAVIVVEHYLENMEHNIIKFDIPESGRRFVEKIKRRLLLNKNVQLYQLASLFSLDGIVRYRNIMKNTNNIYDIPEDPGEYWHEINRIIISDRSNKVDFIDVNQSILDELDKYISILHDFDDKIPLKKRKSKHQIHPVIAPILKNIMDGMPKAEIGQLRLTKFYQKVNKCCDQNEKKKKEDGNYDSQISSEKKIDENSNNRISLIKDKKSNVENDEETSLQPLKKLSINKKRTKKKIIKKRTFNEHQNYDSQFSDENENYDRNNFNKNGNSNNPISISSDFEEMSSEKNNEIINELENQEKTGNNNENNHFIFCSKNKNHDNQELKEKEYYDGQISDEKESYESQISDEKENYDSQISDEKENYDSQISDEKENYDSQISDEKESYESQISDEKENYDSQISDEKENYDSQISDEKENYDMNGNANNPILISSDFEDSDNKSDDTTDDDSDSEENHFSESEERQRQQELMEEKKGEKLTEYYQTIEDALQWKNISNLILKNFKYFNLAKDEAHKLVTELNALICTNFSILEENCPGSVNCESDFFNFWNSLNDFEYKPGKTFSIVTKVAYRLYPICCSESGAERAFSKLKWKFPDRRSRTNRKAMVNELYVENSVTNKLRSNEKFEETMWQLPPSKE